MRVLTPADLTCDFSDQCSDICYKNCCICGNNKIAVESNNKEKEKKHFFKKIK